MNDSFDLLFSILNSENDIDKYYDIFNNFSNTEKLLFIKILSTNHNISNEFYSLFISKIYENNKSFLTCLDYHIIIATKICFPEFYFQFISFLYFSDFDFNLFENNLKDNTDYIYPTSELVTETLEYICFIRSMKNF